MLGTYYSNLRIVRNVTRGYSSNAAPLVELTVRFRVKQFVP